MSDETLMLGEDETLALLRSGRTGTEPELADVTPVAVRGGLRMRRRRRAGQAAAGVLTAAATVAALVVATPDLIKDSRGDVAVADGARDPAAMTAEDLHIHNLRVLTDAFGPDFRIVRPENGAAYVAPAPGSTAGEALPADYRAEATVVVSAADTPCVTDADREGTTTDCRMITAPDGRQVELESRGGSLKPDIPVETRTVRLTQPDGDAVRVILRVEPAVVSNTSARVPRDAILAWIAPYLERLAKVAIDGRTAPGSLAERADPAPEPNDVVLQRALGPAFTADGDGEQATLDPRSPAAQRLPAGYTAHASLILPESAPDQTCTPSRPDADNVARCAFVPTADGRQVKVQTFADYLSSDGILVARTSAYFVRADGQVVWASLHVRGTEDAEARSRASRDRVVAWLDSFVQELVTAVTDSAAHR